MSDEPTITLSELETVPQNVWGVNPVIRERPYLSSADAQRSYMKFMGYEKGVLTARVMELNSRAEQIAYIYECHRNKAYLAVVDRTITTSRSEDSYFYEWLDELAASGIAYAARKKVASDITQDKSYRWAYRWDDIEKTVNICLKKGLSLEEASKVASIGIKAVKKYIETGIISLDDMEEARNVVGDTLLPAPLDEGEEEPTNDCNETQGDILRELATANSSRGASLLAKDRIGRDYVRVSNILPEKETDKPGFVKYSVEICLVKYFTGEYTPYHACVYFENDTPIQAIKFALGKWSEALSRIV